MTFSEAFYGTYKIDACDGKPHLKEPLYYPFDDFWSGILRVTGAGGCIMFLLQFSIELQVLFNRIRFPERHEPVSWVTFLLPIGMAATTLLLVPILGIPRWFRCRGNMRATFFTALGCMGIIQVASSYLAEGRFPTFSLRSLGEILWLLATGLIGMLLYAAAACFMAVGIVALVNVFIAKYRQYKSSK